MLCLSVALAVASHSGVERRVSGGEEVVVEHDHPVAHVLAGGGRVSGWSGHRLSWSAPAVCVARQVSLFIQSSLGGEEVRRFEVVPSSDAGSLDVVHRGGGAWEVHLRSDVPVSWVASAGDLSLDASSPKGGCLLAMWRLPEQRPDLAVVAAFARGRLIGWRAVPILAKRVQAVDASPGARVEVRVDGRRFVGSADPDGIARVAIEVGPGVRLAEIVGRHKRVAHDLSPPPVRTTHFVTDPTGSSWCFVTDDRGNPVDRGDVRDAEHIAPGVYRYSHVGGTADLSEPRIPTVPRRWTLRGGGAWALGAEVRQGIAAFAGTTMPSGIAVTAGALFSGIRHDRADGSGTLLRRALVWVAWAEWPIAFEWRALHLEIAPGVGGALAFHETESTFGADTSERELGPSTTLAVRLGLGPVDLETRGFWSTVRLKAEPERVGVWFGVGARTPL